MIKRNLPCSPCSIKHRKRMEYIKKNSNSPLNPSAKVVGGATLLKNRKHHRCALCSAEVVLVACKRSQAYQVGDFGLKILWAMCSITSMCTVFIRGGAGCLQ